MTGRCNRWYSRSAGTDGEKLVPQCHWTRRSMWPKQIGGSAVRAEVGRTGVATDAIFFA